MGYYHYCWNCKEGLPEPTPREDLLDGGQKCPSCGKRQDQQKIIEEWIVELYENMQEDI